MMSSTATTMMTLILMTTIVDGARILITCPQMKSHQFQQLSVGEALVRRGHLVYVAVGSAMPPLNPEWTERCGIRTIAYDDDDRSGSRMSYEEATDRRLADVVFRRKPGDLQADAYDEASQVSKFVGRDCDSMLSDVAFVQEVRKLDFDLVLLEPFLLLPCHVILPHVLGIPFVSLTSGYFPWTIRVPALPSFYPIPSPITTNLKPSGFLDTLTNLRLYLGIHLSLIPSGWNRTLLQMHAPGVSSYDQLIRRSELFLTDNDHRLNAPMPLFPNVVTVSGLTATPPKPLTGNLARIIDESADGVVLVSLGSTAQHLPAEVIRKFFDAFGRLRLTVIGKFGVPAGIRVPKNVHALSWIPQNDILGHQRTRLFITHCGSNGQYEALYHGVPMLGFPLFAEQPYNCRRVVQKGFGLELDPVNFTASELYDDIVELLTNDTYRKTIRKMSDAWRDEPMIGREKAAFWIEHVIKYGGGHLRSPASDLPLYRFLMLDVLALLLLAVFCLTVVVLFTCSFVRKFFGGKPVSGVSVSKKLQ